MAFDITSVLKTAADETVGQEAIVYLDIDLLDPDDCNFYSLDGLDELAGNIELIGLQQPLRVRPAEGGRYTIISGHRRRAAILLIRDGGSKQFEQGVPCIVEYGEASAAMRELRLIYANSATRKMTPADVSRQAERVEALLYELQEQGVEFPGRMRDHVAQACQVSKTKIARLHAIRANLDEGFLEYFDRGELSEEAAYQLQRLPADIQAEAVEWLATGKRKKLPVAWVVEQVNKNLEAYQQELSCRCHAGGPECHWKREKILRSLFAPYEWQVCDPGKCCRDCYHGSSCSGACQEQKDRAKLDKACEKEKEDEHKKKRDAENAVYKSQRQKQAKRILQLPVMATLDEKTELPGEYWKPITVKEVRRIAAGDFGDEQFYNGNMLPENSGKLMKWADTLGCSVDYLLGRNPVPQPVSKSDTAPGWQTGTPEQTGEYVIACGVPAEERPGSVIKTIKIWNGESWADAKGVPLLLTVYRWIYLPEA